MKKGYLVSMLTILLSFLSSGVVKSSDLLFPVVIGQKFIYERYYEAYSYNFWFHEYEIIGEVSMCSENYTHLRSRNYNNNGETTDHYFRSTNTCIYVCISGVECCSLGIGPVGKTWTCGDDEIEIMPSEEVSVYYGDYTAVVNKKYNTVENSPPWITHLVPGLGIVKEVDYWNDHPPMIMELIKIEYPSAEITGTWSNGIRYWDEAASKWTQMTSYTTTGDIAAGDFTGDGKVDVASIWSDGLWYQDGATLAWTKVDSLPPFSVTAGDVTGDGRSEVIGTWSSGIWYWDFAASKWTQMTSYTCNGDIAAGDFTGDGKADVASCWNDGLWYQDGATLAWTKIDNLPPLRVTTGDVTGDGRSEIIGTWDSGIWYWDFVLLQWTQMTSYTNNGDIAAGDFTGDGMADVASIWSDGLWYQDGDTLDWAKIDNSPPYRVTAGAVTGK